MAVERTGATTEDIDRRQMAVVGVSEVEDDDEEGKRTCAGIASTAAAVPVDVVPSTWSRRRPQCDQEQEVWMATAHPLPTGHPKDVKITPSLPRSESLPETPGVAANKNFDPIDTDWFLARKWDLKRRRKQVQERKTKKHSCRMMGRNKLVLGKKVGLEATEEASPGKKDEAAQPKNEEKNDRKEDQSRELKQESMT
ncbi:hypothetical protein AKJ16_DCAP25754 [Drosera capensis]